MENHFSDLLIKLYIVEKKNKQNLKSAWWQSAVFEPTWLSEW